VVVPQLQSRGIDTHTSLDLPGMLAPRQSTVQGALLLLLHLFLLVQPHAAKDERTQEQLIAAVADAVLSGPVPSAPYTLSACAVFWNEKPYLFEWVVYHYLLGVQHFYLYGACFAFSGAQLVDNAAGSSGVFNRRQREH
jgi:hypothetical protein